MSEDLKQGKVRIVRNMEKSQTPNFLASDLAYNGRVSMDSSTQMFFVRDFDGRAVAVDMDENIKTGTSTCTFRWKSCRLSLNKYPPKDLVCEPASNLRKCKVKESKNERRGGTKIPRKHDVDRDTEISNLHDTCVEDSVSFKPLKSLPRSSKYFPRFCNMLASISASNVCIEDAIFSIKDVPTHGNCFFSSLNIITGSGDSRKLVSNSINHQKWLNLPKITKEELSMSFGEWKEYISRDGNWVNTSGIHAAMHVFELEIVLLKPDGKVLPLFLHDFPPLGSRRVYLLHQNEIHFQVLDLLSYHPYYGETSPVKNWTAIADIKDLRSIKQNVWSNHTCAGVKGTNQM